MIWIHFIAHSYHQEDKHQQQAHQKTIKDLEQSPMATAYFQSLILLKR